MGGLAAVFALGYYGRLIAGLDAFSTFRNGKALTGVDATLSNLRIQAFDNNSLVMRADVDQVTIGQSRQIYEIIGVHDGFWKTREGELRFDGPAARWNVPTKMLDANLGGHVISNDMDLHAAQFAFNSQTSMLNIPGAVTGKLKGGDLQATAVSYNIGSGDFDMGHADWSGSTALEGQDGEVRKWHFTGKITRKGDIETVTNGFATDETIIVLADTIVHDKVTDLVTATGNVKYFSAKANLICEKAVIERKIKKATLTGKVQMLVKAKDKQVLSADDGVPKYRPLSKEEVAKAQANTPGQTEEQKKLDDELRSSENMKSYPTICYADKIVYWYKRGERKAEISGDPQARQELSGGRWRQVWTDHAFYDGEKETLKMMSSEGKMDTRMINSIGDDFVTTYVVTSTVDGSNDYEAGDSKGYMSDYSDEIPKDGGKGSTPPPAAKTKSGGGRFKRA